MAEELQETMTAFAEALRQLTESLNARQQGGRITKRAMDLRAFEKIDSLSGNEDQWGDWSFVFENVVNRESIEAGNVMTWMLQKSDAENVEKDLDIDAGSHFAFQVQPLSRELYYILVNTTKGDALRVVRGIDARDGFRGRSSTSATIRRAWSEDFEYGCRYYRRNRFRTSRGSRASWLSGRRR